jgi:hypothetical protein
MKALVYVFLILTFCNCKSEKKKPQNTLSFIPKKSSKNVTLPVIEDKYDFSSITKDTIFISGKQIVFTKPSQKEYLILKKKKNIDKLDSDFKLYTSKVIDSLDYKYQISYTEKRIIGIVTSRDTIYVDRLNPQLNRNPFHYSAILVFNDYYTISQNNYTDIYYYHFIEDYYSNIRYEKPIEFKYVISRNGLNIRDENGTIDGKFNNGDFVLIIDYKNEIIEIEHEGETIKDSIAIIKWQLGGTTKKGYVFNGLLGSKEDVKVYGDQICFGSIVKPDNRYDNVRSECLDEYFDFKLISELDYNSTTTVNSEYLTSNPLVRVDVNEDNTQNISLPIDDSLLIFESESEYNRSSHSYIGDIDFLNQYLMYNVYYKAEDAYYTLLDKATGKKTFSFYGYPNISPNRKQIITFNYDDYSEEFCLTVHEINNDKSIKAKNVFKFLYWLELSEHEIKWLSDKEFAIAIVNQNIWNGSSVKNPQYLKVQLKK